MENRNKIISYIGWFLVWLKDEDKNIFVDYVNQKAYIYRKDTPIGIFKEYLKSRLVEYQLNQTYGADINEEEFMNWSNSLYESIMKTFTESDNKLILDVSEYNFKWS